MRTIFPGLPLLVLAGTGAMVSATPTVPIFDGHIHYNQDVWDALTPAEALDRLASVGITRALVSSTPTEGTERLYRAAPERVVPLLRPYPTPAHRHTWYKDAAILDYVREQLARIPYRGIGEFHLFSSGMLTPVVAEVIDIARQAGLVLHAHTDIQGLEVLLARAAGLTLIWAHAGVDVPADRLRDLLSRHADLYMELSLRQGVTDEEGKLTEAWRGLFMDYRERFLIGMDTFSPNRWALLPGLAAEARAWLEQLPAPVADDIRRGNAQRLFGDHRAKTDE